MSENNEMNSLINQAKSEARSECVKKFFAKNGKIITTVATFAVVGVVGFAAFALYQNSQEEKFSEIFHQALIDQQLGDMNKAREGLQKIYETSSAPKGVKSLASLRYAAMLLDENKKAEAGEVYKKISECGNCDSYVKDLGGLLAVKTWLSDEEEIQKEDLLVRIEKIESNSKELRYQISEQKAFLQIQKNNLSKAYEILESISKSPEVTQTIKTRVLDGMKMIVAKGYQPAAEEAKTTNIESKK